MPARKSTSASNKRAPASKTTHKKRHAREASESDFSEDDSDLDISDVSDFSEDESDSESDYTDSEADYDSYDDDEESEAEPPRRRSTTRKATVTKKAQKSKKTAKKAAKKRAAKKATKTRARVAAKKAKKTAGKGRGKGKTAAGRKGKGKGKGKTTRKKSSGLSEKRLRGRNIPLPMLSAVVEPPKDEQGNIIPPVKQDRKFLLVNENGTATTKAYTAKGPYQAALKAANRLDVNEANDTTSTTEIRLREPNSQIMYVYDGKRLKLPPAEFLFFFCENNKRKKVTLEEKKAILKKDPEAKIIPVCHKSVVKRRERVKLNEVMRDDVAATA